MRMGFKVYKCLRTEFFDLGQTLCLSLSTDFFETPQGAPGTPSQRAPAFRTRAAGRALPAWSVDGSRVLRLSFLGGQGRE